MSNSLNSSYNMRLMEELAYRHTIIHRIHPLVKLLTTLVYLVLVVSFNRYEIVGLLPFFLYPVLVITLAELPVGAILKRILWVGPLILGIGILNPVFDHQTVMINGIVFSRGWITFSSILIKSILTVAASLILVATTGMNGLAMALRQMKVPRLFVLQLLLTYRYIALLLEEVARILRAYALRAPRHQGIRRRAWGSLVGQLVLRTVDRAERLYQAMCLRGFAGEYHPGRQHYVIGRDLAYLVGWMLFFLLVRVYDLPQLIGYLITGGIE